MQVVATCRYEDDITAFPYMLCKDCLDMFMLNAYKSIITTEPSNDHYTKTRLNEVDSRLEGMRKRRRDAQAAGVSRELTAVGRVALSRGLDITI